MKLLVIDGNSLLNRAFYGIKQLSTREGIHTNGIYGFLRIFFKLCDEVSPDAAAVAFDLHAPTFRHKKYAGYKAGRRPMPDELREQVPILKDVLDKMGIVRLEKEGYEADDILGTEGAACTAHGYDCVIATGDRDSLQLVGGRVRVMLATTKGGRPVTTLYDEKAVMETYGVSPKALIEVKALMGDASDKIPGVAGVGEKTALSLIKEYGSIKYIYDNLDTLKIRDSLRKKLADGRESAILSRFLGEIRTDAPVDTDISHFPVKKPDGAGLYHLFRKLEFYSFIEKMGLSENAAGMVPSGPDAVPQTTVVLERDGRALLSLLECDGKAFFCTQFENGGPAAVAFARGDGIVAARSGETSGFSEFFLEFLCDGKIKKYTHDIKTCFSYCAEKGVSFTGASFDTMLAGYILDPLAKSYGPELLAAEYGVSLPSFELPSTLSEDGGCMSAAAAVRGLCPEMMRRISKNGQEKLYYEIELPLADVLAKMECAGVHVDCGGIRAFGEKLSQRLADIEKKIYSLAGYEFNINSTKQLGEVLFVKLGLPVRKKTKTGYSTSAEVLEALRGFHPIIGLLLEYRQLSKLKSTYTDGLIKVVAADGRIHSSFNQVDTRTGRISSTEPNLQNIPVRTELGREMRRFFTAEQGHVLVDADYSQIELRLLAHIADDKAMQEAFNNGVDIHTLTASQVFGVPLSMVTPIMRSRAKAVNFGIVYGIGAFSLSKNIGVTVKEADKYIKNYLSVFHGVRDYMEHIINEAHENGYVETLFGRRRALPELNSSNKNVRSFGERAARNTPIQGTAADIIKIAMVRVGARLKKEGLMSKLILQVHDELIVESPNEEADCAARILKEEMEGVLPLKVQLIADVHCGKTWFDAKD